MEKFVSRLYSILFLITPFIFFPKSSELFEFNKMVFVYTLTSLITAAWFIRSILLKKFIFRRSLLDLPLLIFLLSQILATVFSIDRFTSIFGYPSRLNGGLLSIICYLLLYWAYVSNVTKDQVLKHIKVLLLSALFVCIWAIFEHFGHSLSCLLVTGQFDVDCWVQDVQARVFATLGQPNWLAAWITAIIPLTWAIALKFQTTNIKSQTNSKFKNYWIYIVLSSVFFLTLLFTKSRSGLIGFLFANAIFWPIAWISTKKHIKKTNFINTFVICNLLFVISALAVGTPWTPSFFDSTMKQSSNETITATSLETGGTESGTIRKIVWQGAIDLWRSHPLFGTGVETFAYSYYNTRPIEHNLTSEWDFLYNKAHNEYLNLAANSGTFGLVAYTFVIFTFIFWLAKKLKLTINNLQFTKSYNFTLNILHCSFLAGFASLLVTNFFGFSVVMTNLEFFLFPAFAIALIVDSKQYVVGRIELTSKQKILVASCLLTTAYLLLSLGRYWYADFLYAKARSYNDQNESDSAIYYLKSAINLNPQMAIYHDQLAIAYSQLAQTPNYAQLTIQEANLAYQLAPLNVTLLKSRANIFTDLSFIDPKYLVETLKTLEILLTLAPTDPSIYQRIGLTLAQAGELEKSISFFEKAIELKPDYSRAKETLEYIKKAQ